ncbi:MAG: hypothetical protein WAW61_22230 [Methylococcaceae bacterium]
MKITPIIIERFAKFIVGGVPFESMKRIVSGLDNKSVSNENKRFLAIDEFKKMGYALAGALVNLAVELAVVWLKSKSK